MQFRSKKKKSPYFIHLPIQCRFSNTKAVVDFEAMIKLFLNNKSKNDVVLHLQQWNREFKNQENE